MLASTADESLPTLAAANSASDAGEWQLASGLWDRLRAEAPNEALYWRKSGEAYCNAGQLDAADRILKLATRLFPDDLWSAYYYAIVVQRVPDWPEALARARRLRDGFPAFAIGHVLTGEALRELRRFEEAETALAEAVGLFPRDEWVLHGHAQIAIYRNRWHAARERWERMLQAFPENVLALAGWCQALARLGELEEAEAVLEDAIGRAPDDQNTLIRHAWLAANRRDWLAALERWKKVRLHAPESALVLTGTAEALIGLGEIEAATAIVDDILARAPHDPRALECRAELFRRCHPEEAVAQEVQRRGIVQHLADRVADPEVFIEITSICNFSCGYCVSPMKLRDKQHMTMDTFRRAVEQVATMTTKAVRLHIDGEPTSHPQFREMALLVNSHGLPIALATNGSRLDPRLLDIWMDLLISMSVLPEELAKRHGRLNFESYIDRIATYAAAWAVSEARQNLKFQIIRYPQPDADADLNYWERQNSALVDFCTRAGLYDSCVEETSVEEDAYCFRRKRHPGGLQFIKQTVSEGGLYPIDGRPVERERATAGFCDSPWRQLVVHSNGTLGACCVDLSGGTIFATAEEAAATPLKALWEASPQITELRKNFLRGRVAREVCQRCLSQGQVMFAATSR